MDSMKSIENSKRETYWVPEAAERLGLSKAALYKAINSGEIRSIRVGGRILIPKRVIDQLLQPTN